MCSVWIACFIVIAAAGEQRPAPNANLSLQQETYRIKAELRRLEWNRLNQEVDLDAWRSQQRDSLVDQSRRDRQNTLENAEKQWRYGK